jgi:hypothetical protein
MRGIERSDIDSLKRREKKKAKTKKNNERETKF